MPSSPARHLGFGRQSVSAEEGLLHHRRQGQGPERLRRLRQGQGRALLRCRRLRRRQAGGDRHPVQEPLDDKQGLLRHLSLLVAARKTAKRPGVSPDLSRPENELTLQQRACGTELVEDVVPGHG